MDGQKTAEHILKVAAALVAAAMSVVRLIGSIGKMKDSDT